MTEAFLTALTALTGLIFTSTSIGYLTNYQPWGFFTFGVGLMLLAMLAYLNKM